MKLNPFNKGKIPSNPQEFSLENIPARTFRALLRHIQNPASRAKMRSFYIRAKSASK